MRKVLTISITPEVEKEIRDNSKKRGFNSISSYFKYLISLDEDLISKEELICDAKDSIEEYKKGDSIRANSIKDLL